MKGTPGFGPVSGRLGNVTTAVIGGRQITRTINPRPQNPRTKSQMAQRVQLSNIVSTYQVLSSFIKGTYPGRPLTHSAYNMFIKQNLGKVKICLSKAESKAKACVTAPYYISQGTLPSIETVVRGKGLVTSLRVPQTFRITDATTSGEVSNALFRSNSGLHTGDRLTVIRLVQTFSTAGEMTIPRITSELHEFTLDSSSRIPFRLLMPASVFLPTEGFIGTDDDPGNGGIAYVWSREEGNKRSVSTQSIVLTSDNTTYPYYACEEKREEAVVSYGASDPCFFDSASVCESGQPQGIAPTVTASTGKTAVGAIPCGCPDMRTHENAEHEGSPKPKAVTGVSVSRDIGFCYVFVSCR